MIDYLSDDEIVEARAAHNSRAMFGSAERAQWLVVITRERTPQVRLYEDLGEAIEFYDKFSVRWSECFIARILVGPGPGSHEAMYALGERIKDEDLTDGARRVLMRPKKQNTNKEEKS